MTPLPGWDCNGSVFHGHNRNCGVGRRTIFRETPIHICGGATPRCGVGLPSHTTYLKIVGRITWIQIPGNDGNGATDGRKFHEFGDGCGGNDFRLQTTPSDARNLDFQTSVIKTIFQFIRISGTHQMSDELFCDDAHVWDSTRFCIFIANCFRYPHNPVKRQVLIFQTRYETYH